MAEDEEHGSDQAVSSCIQGYVHEQALPRSPTRSLAGSFVHASGVGPKTISCTLLFALDRADFPVDTHVNRIAADLGWVAKSSSREATYEHLNEMLDDDIKYDLHITLVEHGKTCSYCSTRSGSMAAESCPVRAIKASRRKGVGAASVAKVEVKSEDEAWVKEED